MSIGKQDAHRQADESSCVPVHVHLLYLTENIERFT